MPHEKVKVTCENCKEDVDVFLKTTVNINWKYKYKCPHCNKESIFKGSYSEPIEEIPKDAVFAEVI